MKKLIGLAVLASVPVACGTIPSTPDVAAVGTPSVEASFAASGRGGRTIEPGCVASDPSIIRGLTLNVARVGKTSVTVRAEPLVLGGQSPRPCINPTFTVTPAGRGIVLAPELDSQEVTLSAPAGTYLVTATLASNDRAGLSARLLVQVR
jgi:hypothetical protein